jgi:hypothetical protein
MNGGGQIRGDGVTSRLALDFAQPIQLQAQVLQLAMASGQRGLHRAEPVLELLSVCGNLRLTDSRANQDSGQTNRQQAHGFFALSTSGRELGQGRLHECRAGHVGFAAGRC